MKKFWKIVGSIVYIPFIITIFPIILVLVIIDNIKAVKPRKELKVLEHEGFVFRQARKPYRREWVKGKVSIIILGDHDYKISFNYDNPNPIYTNLFESEIGTFEDRERLKSIIVAYENAHPRDQMEGYHSMHISNIEFIRKNMKQIIKLS